MKLVTKNQIVSVGHTKLTFYYYHGSESCSYVITEYGEERISVDTYEEAREYWDSHIGLLLMDDIC